MEPSTSKIEGEASHQDIEKTVNLFNTEQSALISQKERSANIQQQTQHTGFSSQPSER